MISTCIYLLWIMNNDRIMNNNRKLSRWLHHTQMLNKMKSIKFHFDNLHIFFFQDPVNIVRYSDLYSLYIHSKMVSWMCLSLSKPMMPFHICTYECTLIYPPPPFHTYYTSQRYDSLHPHFWLLQNAIQCVCNWIF